MKIAISTMGKTLDTDIDPRFGRCQYFLLVDPDTLNFEVIDNSSGISAEGAGIATAQLVVGKGAEAIITGNCGPNAYQVLTAAGIKVITGASGKVKDAIQSYNSGKLQTSSQPNVAGHFGMGGRGGGMGRGRTGR
jgi:predicted Fe-Mo cluster-binding NifX family protein